MRHVLRATLQPIARLSLATALALIMFTVIQPLGGDSALAANLSPAEHEQLDLPAQQEPDEGGTGVNNFDREEWYQFSILLAPFLVLVVFILILMFSWDRSANNED